MSRPFYFLLALCTGAKEFRLLAILSRTYIFNTQLQRNPVFPLVTLERDQQIDLAGEEFGPMRRIREGDTGERRTPLPDGKLEVTGAAGSDLLGPGVAQQEERFGISGAKGAETLEICKNRQGEIFNQNFTVVKEDGEEIVSA